MTVQNLALRPLSRSSLTTLPLFSHPATLVSFLFLGHAMPFPKLPKFAIFSLPLECFFPSSNVAVTSRLSLTTFSKIVFHSFTPFVTSFFSMPRRINNEEYPPQEDRPLPMYDISLVQSFSDYLW